MNSSVTGSALNQIPLVNSTQILTASAQAPINSVIASTPVVASTPIVASTPVVASTPIVTSAVPQVATPVLGASVPVAQPVVTTSVQPTYNTANFTTTASPPVPDDDYRLGRGILDDFRPTAYKTQVAGVGSTVAVSNPGLVVSTPVANVGASKIDDFL